MDKIQGVINPWPTAVTTESTIAVAIHMMFVIFEGEP
jgi:hypothetical protein